MPTITKPNLYFDVVTYTGTGATQTISGLNFQPDFVWIKSRSAATDNKLTDAVRGVTKGLISNSTGAETTDSTGITAFTSSGFTLGSSSVYNNSGATYVAWCWKANGAGSTNTAGTITSTVSANTTSGFSIVTYTGNSTSGATVGHGLGATPSMVIVKGRDTNGLAWCVYHSSLGATQYLFLDATSAAGSYAGFWNNTAPSSTILTLGNDNGTNGTSKTYVAYCFAPVAGFSAFGSYTGNGSTDGVFVFTGMRPAYVMIKRTSSTGDWFAYNNKSSPSNVVNQYNVLNTAGVEGTYATLDFLSNGFKLRVADAEVNGSGSTFIYMAFAEAPQKFSLAR